MDSHEKYGEGTSTAANGMSGHSGAGQSSHGLTGQSRSDVNGHLNHEFNGQSSDNTRDQSSDGVVIVAACRTPIGTLNGALSSLSAAKLGSVVISEVLRRAQVSPADVDEVVMGQVLMGGAGQNPARQAAAGANIPWSVPAWNVQMVCGSGMKALVSGYQAIRSGDARVVVAGGQESMSQAPHVMCLRSHGQFSMGDTQMRDTCMSDGLTDAFASCLMGVTAENVAAQWAIGREEQDRYAVESQQKAAAAMKRGDFAKEIVPVTVPTRKGPVVVSTDEFVKPDTSIELLSKLRTVFKSDKGSVTAGNATGVNDGAAAVLLMSQSEAQRRGQRPLARIVSWAQVGIDPKIMGVGPIEAIKAALKKAQWTVADVDLFEINEAFAVTSLAVLRDLGIDSSKVNVSGGSIALGHPIGASGCRVVVSLLSAMDRLTTAKKGVASLCIGGGMGIALCIKKCQ